MLSNVGKPFCGIPQLYKHTAASTPLRQVEESSFLVCGKKFPKSTVKNRSDITLGNEIGEGAFGKVYKGFLHLSKHERYVSFVIYESKFKVTQLHTI